MAHGVDWMPNRRVDILAMARKWIAVLPSKKMKLGVTDAEIAELTDLADDVQTAWGLSQASPGEQVRAARTREAFARMVASMRTLRRRRFFNSPMDDSEWLELLLQPPDRVRTDHVEVAEVVEFELTLRNIREVLVNFWVKGADNHAKPLGYDGAVIIWSVLPEPPDGPHELTEHTMASRTPHALPFENNQRGQTVYIALAWQNERGNTGHWSEIQSAVIP